MTFERVIVWPDGHREIEGVTPKQLPAPASHVCQRRSLHLILTAAWACV